MVGGAGIAHRDLAQRLGQAVLDHAFRSEVRGPAQREAAGGHVGLDDRRRVANAGGGDEVHRSTWQELVSSEAVKGELGDDAEQVHGTAGQGFAHEAVAGAHVNDARLSIRREVVGVVARDFLTGERESHAVHADQLALQ